VRPAADLHARDPPFNGRLFTTHPPNILFAQAAVFLFSIKKQVSTEIGGFPEEKPPIANSPVFYLAPSH